MTCKMERLSSLKSVILQYDEILKSKKEDMLASFDKLYSSICQVVDDFSKLLDLRPPPANVLELACGTGLASIELARRGYQVTAIDCSREALSISREFAKKMDVEVRWIQGDMRAFDFGNNMDYVLLWDVVFGICAREEDFLVLKNISHSLKSKGRCLFEVYNKEFAVGKGIENTYFYDSSKDFFVIGNSAPDRPIKSIRLYSHDEWKKMLEENQMRIVKMHGWKWKNDPEPPPWRADFIVAERY